MTNVVDIYEYLQKLEKWLKKNLEKCEGPTEFIILKNKRVLSKEIIEWYEEKNPHIGGDYDIC